MFCTISCAVARFLSQGTLPWWIEKTRRSNIYESAWIILSSTRTRRCRIWQLSQSQLRPPSYRSRFYVTQLQSTCMQEYHARASLKYDVRFFFQCIQAVIRQKRSLRLERQQICSGDGTSAVGHRGWEARRSYGRCRYCARELHWNTVP